MLKNVAYGFLLLLCLLFKQYCYSAKILYIFPTGCKSTSRLHHAISKILINNGHEIFGISPYPLENTLNYTDVGIARQHFMEYSDTSTIGDCVGTYDNLRIIFNGQHESCTKIYANEKIRNFINNTKVDIVLLEIDEAKCFLPLAAQFNVPIIGVSTASQMYSEFDGIMGNPINPSYIPTTMSGFSCQMDFFQRLSNAKNFIIHWILEFYFTRKANLMIAQNMQSPPIEELYDKISLVFYNSHFTYISKPIAPNCVGIAGIHIPSNSSPLPLPDDIERFVNGAEKGVIYFSLGSVVKFSAFPKHIHEAYVNAFKKLPYRIIWRHDNPEMLANISENILASYWLPQIDILAHKKVILFMSHSGAFSTYEAVHFTVPLLTFPVSYDQFTNAAIMQDLGIGLSLNLRNLDENSLLTSINEVIQNKKYRENMNKISKIFADRPQTPEESLLYWVEYVLRHKNTSFLKSAGSKLPFYQYLLIDVILFLLMILFFMIWTFRVLLKLVRYVVKNRVEKIKVD